MSEQGDCEHWRGLLAVEAVGHLEDDDGAALLRHLQGCDRCRADRAELAATVPALALAERAFLDHGAPGDDLPFLPVATPPAPGAAPEGSLPEAGGRHGRAVRSGWTPRRALVGLSAAAAAAAVLTAGLLGAFGGGSSPSPTVPALTLALHGRAGSHGTAVLVSEPWGTSIELDDRVASTPQVFTVSMSTQYGRAWFAGTYRSVAGTDVRVTLGCALSLAEVRGVTVTDSSGHVVLQS